MAAAMNVKQAISVYEARNKTKPKIKSALKPSI